MWRFTINGKDIQTLVDNASGSGLTKTDIDGKQDILTAGNNISINTTTDTTTNITTTTISSTVQSRSREVLRLPHGRINCAKIRTLRAAHNRAPAV